LSKLGVALTRESAEKREEQGIKRYQRHLGNEQIDTIGEAKMLLTVLLFAPLLFGGLWR